MSYLAKGGGMAVTTKREPDGAIPTQVWQDLQRTFRAINSEKEFVPMVLTALRQACKLFQAEGALLLLANQGTGLLEIAAVEAVSAEALERYRRAPARIGALGAELDPQVARRELERIRDLAADCSEHLLLPILLQEKILGALMLTGPGPERNYQDHPEYLNVFLEYLAQSIENAYLIFQLRQQNANLELMMTRLQNTQNHLKRAENLAMVGKFAAGVAHEVRNPLTVVGTTLQLVFEKMDPENPERGLYATMIEKVREVDRTIKEMLAVARPLPVHRTGVNLRAGVEKVLVFLQKKLSSRSLEVLLEFPEDLPRAWADDEQWQRILINLFLNSLAFLPAGGKIRLRGRHEQNAPWVEVVFSDNGPGVSDEQARQIFEPFFSTRAEGTGLGLFLLRHWLEEMNGGIELVSRPGEGAAFELKLPVEEPQPPAGPKTVLGAGGTGKTGFAAA
jgi:signal transduction histidine kinase